MTHKKQRLAVLGSTGSIGTQTLDIVRRYGDLFEVTTLTARSRWEALVAQAIEFSPDNVVIADETYYPAVRDALARGGWQAVQRLMEHLPDRCQEAILFLDSAGQLVVWGPSDMEQAMHEAVQNL